MTTPYDDDNSDRDDFADPTSSSAYFRGGSADETVAGGWAQPEARSEARSETDPGAAGYGGYGAQSYGAQDYGTQYPDPFGQQFGGQQQFSGQAYGQPYAQPYAGMQPYPSAARKDPALMLVASLIIPGLGTILNGETGKGIGILGGYIVGAVLSVVLIGLPIMLGFWIWGMVDAYQGANAHNRRHGLP